jgi:CheY-like chemotaxis protein
VESRGKTRILVVEDNPSDVVLLRWALANAELDCELIVMEDGGEALAFVQQGGKDTVISMPDLAILDLNLPSYDGLEILQAMRASRIFKDLNVAILSSATSPGKRTKLDALGIARYIEKPFDLNGILEIGFVVKDLLESDKVRRAYGLLAAAT